MVTPSQRLQQLQDEAYSAVIKVLVAQDTMSFKTDLMLTKLRETLGVTDERHRTVLEGFLNEAEEAAAPPAPPPQPPVQLIKPLPAPGPRAPATSGRGVRRAASQALPALSHDSQSTADAPTPIGARDTDAEARRSKKQKKMALLPGPPSVPAAPEPMIGTKVARLWPEGWFEGVITDYNPTTGEHCITYELGSPKEEFEWYNVHTAPTQECKILDEKVSLTGLSNSRAIQTSQFLKQSRGRGKGVRGSRGGGGSRMVYL